MLAAVAHRAVSVGIEENICGWSSNWVGAGAVIFRGISIVVAGSFVGATGSFFVAGRHGYAKGEKDDKGKLAHVVIYLDAF